MTVRTVAAAIGRVVTSTVKVLVVSREVAAEAVPKADSNVDTATRAAARSWTTNVAVIWTEADTTMRVAPSTGSPAVLARMERMDVLIASFW